MTIKADGTDGLQVKRIFEASGSGPRNITISDHLGNGGSLFNGNIQIGAVYASRGLDDKSSYLQCNGVYGREVASTAANESKSNNIDHRNHCRRLCKLLWYNLDGAIPGSPETQVGSTTTVSSIMVNTITLSANLTAEIPAASNIVFIKWQIIQEVIIKNSVLFL